MTRSRIHKTTAVFVGVAALLGAVVINALVAQTHLRLDLTDEGIYTLSDVSQQAASKLDEPVEVRAFISRQMPPPYHQLDRRVEQILMEYEAASGGQLTYEIIAPDDSEHAQGLARDYGIEPVTVGEHTDTEQSYRQVYKGVAFSRGDRQEVIEQLRVSPTGEVDDFEYEFTRALLHLHDAEPRRVGLLTGLGGPADHPEFVRQLQFLFDTNYGQLLELEPLQAEQLAEAGDELSAVVALNVRDSLGEQGIQALHQFVERGGNIGWFQSGGIVDEQQLHRQAHPEHPGFAERVATTTDLIDYFELVGVQFGADAVIDRDRALAYGPVPTREGMVRVEHPGLFPIRDIARELPFARHFSTLVVPMPATVEIDESQLAGGVTAYPVLRTEESSVKLPRPPAVALYDELNEPASGEQQGPHTVAVALDGPIAAGVPAGADGPPQQPEDARALVVGSGDLIGSEPVVGYGGELTALGVEFFLNGVEWLAQKDDLADIRGKAMPALVADVPTSSRRAIQIINIALVPALFATIGLFMWIRRRRRKNEIAECIPGDSAS